MARLTRKEFLGLAASLGGGAGMAAWSSRSLAASTQNPPARPPVVARPPAPLLELACVLPLAHARFFSDAELVIDNNGPEDQRVEPIWHADGRQVPGEPIAVATLQSLVKPLVPLLPAGVTLANLNGLLLHYPGRAVDQVAAQVTLLGSPASGPRQSLDVPLVVSFDRKGRGMEAVWATPRGDERSVIALFNLRADPHTIRIVDAASTTPVTIAPSGSYIITRPASATTGLDWIRIDTDDAIPAIFPAGFTMSPGDRLPRMITFFDPDRGLQSDIVATGLRVYGTTLTLALKNTSPFDLAAVVTFLDPDRGIPLVELPRVNLPARGAQRVDLTPLLSSGGALPHTLAVRVRNSGAAGSLIGDLHATDPATGLTYAVPLRNAGADAGSVRARTGNCPIRLDGDYQTRLLFTNAGDIPLDFAIRILHAGGSYIPKVTTMAVGTSITLDLRRLRDDRTIDGMKQPLPADFERGLCIWSTRSKGIDGMLAGRAELVSVSRRVCSSITW